MKKVLLFAISATIDLATPASAETTVLIQKQSTSFVIDGTARGGTGQ